MDPAQMDLNKMKELEERIKAPSEWGKAACGIRFEDLQDVRYEEAIRFLKKHYIGEEPAKGNAQMDLNMMKELEERIKAPEEWGKAACGIRFEDLQDLRYEEAIRFLKKHYIAEEITWRSVNILSDKEGTDELVHNMRIWLKDKMSIAVIREGKEKLVGLLIMRIQYKNAFSRTFSRVKLTYNEKYTKVMKFLNELEGKVDLYKALGVKRYLKIYVLALKQRYRHRGLAKQLLSAATGLAASAFIPALTGTFLTSRSQQIATELGFQKFAEIYYVKYLIDGQIVFWDTGQGNYGAALMGYRIPGVEEPEEVVLEQEARFSVKKDDEDDQMEDDDVEKNKDLDHSVDDDENL